MGQLGLGVNAVDLAAILRNGSEGDDVVEIPAKTLLGVVDVLDQGLNVLLAALVERHHDELGASEHRSGHTCDW